MATAGHITGTNAALRPGVVDAWRYRGIANEFELWAPNFHKTITQMMGRYFQVVYDDLVTMLADRVAAQKPQRVLEIGCGTGLVMSAIASRLDPGGRVCGIDVVPAMLEQCQLTAKKFELEDRLEFLQAPAERIPYPANSFDVVYSSLCFHHFKTRQALSEQLRVLRPGGRLIVFDIGALDAFRTLKGRLFYTCMTRVRYLTMPHTRDEFWAVHRTRSEWEKLLGEYPVELLTIEDHSKRTGKLSEEKWLFGKYVTYTSMGTPPLFFVEARKLA